MIDITKAKEILIKLLKEANVPSAKLDSNIILSDVLKLEPHELYYSDRILTELELKQAISLSKRRASYEPIAYIIHKKEFYSLDFFVSPDVLIPRPDSETIVDTILENIAVNHQKKHNNSIDTKIQKNNRTDKNKKEDNLNINSIILNKDKISILELGVGSGAIILTLLHHIKNAEAIAVDISIKALEIAKHNSKHYNLASRISFIHSNWFSNVPDKKFDIIISNPPYIETKEINNLPADVKKFEPLIALDGGINGLDCYNLIARQLDKFTHNNSLIVFEIGYNQQTSVTNIMKQHNFVLTKTKQDLSSITRVLLFTKN